MKKIIITSMILLVVGCCTKFLVKEETTLQNLQKASFLLTLKQGPCSASNIQHNGHKVTITAGHCCMDIPNDLLLFVSLNPDVCIFKEDLIKTKVYLKMARKKAQIGSKVYTNGYPRGVGPFIFEGTVSHLTDEGIQTSIPFLPGQSGSPLINSDGELIGIGSKYYIYIPNTAIFTNQKDTLSVINKVLKKGKKK